jgi:hypothetical protein
MFSASSGARELFRDLAPIRLFFSLNFSSQLALKTWWFSGVVVVEAKALAFSRMMSSDNGCPLRSLHTVSSVVAQVDKHANLIFRPNRKRALDIGRASFCTLDW